MLGPLRGKYAHEAVVWALQTGTSFAKLVTMPVWGTCTKTDTHTETVKGCVLRKSLCCMVCLSFTKMFLFAETFWIFSSPTATQFGLSEMSALRILPVLHTFASPAPWGLSFLLRLHFESKDGLNCCNRGPTVVWGLPFWIYNNHKKAFKSISHGVCLPFQHIWASKYSILFKNRAIG